MQLSYNFVGTPACSESAHWGRFHRTYGCHNRTGIIPNCEGRVDEQVQQFRHAEGKPTVLVIMHAGGRNDAACELRILLPCILYVITINAHFYSSSPGAKEPQD